MTLATLRDVLLPAMQQGRAIAGLVVLGWEDARAYVEAAEETGIPVILQAGPGCRRHTPVPVLAAMLRHLADQASVPVVCHLDHGYTIEECREGIDCGFTSIMFDGSARPLSQNIDMTAALVEHARQAGVSVEGEVGLVGYAQGKASTGTDPAEAGRFERETGVDALAISIGNVHMQTEKSGGIDFGLLAKIEELTTLPLVLHGGSGIPVDIRMRLAATSRVTKFNIGTELRMAFGQALRRSLESQPKAFDRIELLAPVIEPVKAAAIEAITPLFKPSVAA